MKIMRSRYSYITLLVLNFSFIGYSQKPKKIFSEIKENNLQASIEEFQKIETNKEYDLDDRLYFEIANCLFLINQKYLEYNPIESCKLFNKIQQNSDLKKYLTEHEKKVNEFLLKYELSFVKIEDMIQLEVLKEAKKINSIESYDNALNVSKEPYNNELLKLKEIAYYFKTLSDNNISSLKLFLSLYPQSKFTNEIQLLLEKKVFEKAKNNGSISELNLFISEYKTSTLKQIAIDLRDSLHISKIDKQYDSLVAFLDKNPNSKFTEHIKLRLPDVLYEESIKLNTVQALQKFVTLYPNDIRVNKIEEKLLEKRFNIKTIDLGFDFEFSKIGFSEGVSDIFKCEKFDCKSGYIDTMGRIKIQLIYTEVNSFSEGLASVELNGKRGVINHKSEIIVPFKYDEIGNYFEGLAYAGNYNFGYGYIDKKGVLKIPLIYNLTNDFKNGYAIVGIQNNKLQKFGVINKNGKLVIPLIYDEIKSFDNKNFVVSINKKHGVVDINNKIIIPMIYSYLTDYNGLDLFVVVKDSKYGVIDLNNKILIELKYDFISIINKNYFIVGRNEKFGVIDSIENLVIPFIYNVLYGFDNSNDLFWTNFNGKIGVINKNGEVKVPFLYDDLLILSNDLSRVWIDGKYGIIDNKTGKILFPIIYDNISDFCSDGYFFTKKNNQIDLIKQNW